ncbi:MAG: hypothetical protein J2P31_07600 [Blastocatellia bacterium]|nr:hypothetical protein [Blastocatellia bacterium]MBO0798673.1 hypothetical protein [Blastocatellia bacterium]
MPQKNIYVKDSDVELIEWAEKHAGDSLSNLFAECLRQRKDRIDRRLQLSKDGLEAIAIQVNKRKKMFVGKWIVSKFVSTKPGVTSSTLFDVAFTKGGRIAVLVGERYQDDYSNMDVFETFPEFEASEYPRDLVAAVGDQLGEDYVEVLDI